MTTRARAKYLALASTVALAALLVGAGATSASAHTSASLVLEWGAAKGVLTLPSSDSFEDTIPLGISSS